jgi:hypothetical protein
MKSSLYFYILGLYWPFLFSVTGSFTISQGLFALLFTALSLFILLNVRNRPLFVLFLIVIVTSIMIFYLGFFSGGSLQRSLSDSSRLVFFFFYFAVGSVYASKPYFDENALIKVILVYCILSIIFSLLVYFPFLHPLVNLFKGRLSDDILQFHFFRFSGFSGFPTDLGALLTLGICILLYVRRINLFSKKKRLALLLFLVLGIIGSVSRGAMLHLGVAGILYSIGIMGRVFINRKISKLMLSTIFITLCVLPILGIALIDINIFENNASTQYMAVDISNPDASVLHRFKEVNGAYNVLFDRLFIFGEERDRPLGLPVIEGFWTHWILRYSWIGLYIGLIFCSFLALIAKRSDTVLGRGAFLWMCSFLLSEAFFSDVLFRFKGPLVYGFIFGVCFTLYLQKSKIKYKKTNKEKY